jgi:hypothetical protein
MNNTEESSEYGFDFIVDGIRLDSLFKYLFKKKCCVCNKLALFLFILINISIGLGMSLVLVLALLLLPFFSMFVDSSTKKEEIFLNNSTYYEVFTKLNNGIDYQSDIDKLKYLSISSFLSLTLLFILLLIPYFQNKIKSVYFLLIFFLFNTCVLIINIFISIIYSRIEDTLKKYPNELDNMFASNGTHIISLDKRNNLGPYGSSSIYHCIMNYLIILIMLILKRIHEIKISNNDNGNDNEINENLNPTN